MAGAIVPPLLRGRRRVVGHAIGRGAASMYAEQVVLSHYSYALEVLVATAVPSGVSSADGNRFRCWILFASHMTEA
jgi:hypothetical protein